MDIQKGTIQYCGGCGLPKINCVCGDIPQLHSDVEFWIIIHERERIRPTNTGKLIQKLLEHNVTLEIWQRKQVPKGLYQKLQSDQYQPYLVFPADTEALQKRVVENLQDDDRKLLFILLDGTWQEAKKIMRKSEYLNNVPIIAFDPQFESKFVLRKNQEKTHLCTFETATQLLRMVGEKENAERMEYFFDQYLMLFQSGRCGHKRKT